MSAHDQAEIIVSLPVLSNVRPTYIHSFGFTENFFIFADHPFGINIPKAVVSRALATPTYKFIEYDPNGIVQFR